MSKHTAGPWMIRELAHSNVPGQTAYAIEFNDGQEQVADWIYEKADALLISAAPELLEAIENLLWHAEHLEELIESERGKGRSSEQLYADGEMNAYMVEAKSCIAKARGEAK